MPASVAALPGLTRYTWWDQVPEGLLTKTQLSEQGLKPGGDPVGQVLYHGNSYAPLYVAADAAPKRTVSPAQKAALDRARALQYECRRCGAKPGYPLGKGRVCEPCSYAVALWELHSQAQAAARTLVADPAAVLLVVDVDPEALPLEPNVAAVSIYDHQVLYTAHAGAYGTSERGAVIDQLDALLAGRRVIGEPDHMGPLNRYPDALLREPARVPRAVRAPEHPWSVYSQANPNIAHIWAPWFGYTDHPTSTIPCLPRDGVLAWQRSLDVAADGQSMSGLLHRIAEGVEPVWSGALWLADGHGEPGM